MTQFMFYKDRSCCYRMNRLQEAEVEALISKTRDLAHYGLHLTQGLFLYI